LSKEAKQHASTPVLQVSIRNVGLKKSGLGLTGIVSARLALNRAMPKPISMDGLIEDPLTEVTFQGVSLYFDSRIGESVRKTTQENYMHQAPSVSTGRQAKQNL
jgi:hypothetical protein